MIMNGKNQAKCPYCNKFCKKTSTACVGYGKHAKWQECPECKTRFAVGPRSILRGARYKVLDSKHDDAYYVMEINYKQSWTGIYHYTRPDYKLSTTEGLVSGARYIVSGSSTGPRHFVYTGGKLIWSHTGKTIVKLEKALKDITPKNVYDRMMMYVLFS